MLQEHSFPGQQSFLGLQRGEGGLALRVAAGEAADTEEADM